MQNFTYLIIGGGMTADAAAEGIRSRDKTGSIGMFTREAFAPYNRPPLSKALWKGEKEDIIWRKPPKDNVHIFLSTCIKTVDPKNKIVTDNNGEKYSYQKLLFATGGKVNRLPFSEDGVIYFRNYDDYKKLRTMSAKGKSFVVIGGGFIGSEVAAALALNGVETTMIFPEDAIGSRVFPASLSGYITDYYRQKGVRLMVKDGVKDIMKQQNRYKIFTRNGKVIEADGIVAGIGIHPDVEVALSAGLKTDNGIVVNEYLQSSLRDVYAAGDVANYPDAYLGKRRRVEHEDGANMMGRIAGENMAGGSVIFNHLPLFYSDLFDLGYEAVGEIDSKLETVEQWKEKFREGIVYYLDNNRLAGVLLWNTWNQADNARKLIASRATSTKESILNALPM